MAECRGVDPAVFLDPDSTDEALAICDTCVVQAACIVVNLRERNGVWGCSERARRRVRTALAADPSMSDDEIVALARRGTTVTMLGSRRVSAS